MTNNFKKGKKETWCFSTPQLKKSEKGKYFFSHQRKNWQNERQVAFHQKENTH
jgi:hypothetical protein